MQKSYFKTLSNEIPEEDKYLLTKEELFNMYKDNFISEYPYFSIKTIEYMLDGITRYDVLMTEVATETPKPKGMGFLGII
jgi:hypothetical protein